MVRAKIVVLLTALAAFACAASSGPAEVRERQRYGRIMADLGHRFELLGRAGSSERWELAAFELDEMEEAYEDLGHALPPRRVAPAELRRCERQFANPRHDELRRATVSRDEAAFVRAFAHVAEKCNACHHACRHGFIEVPSTPGAAVPEVRSRDELAD